MSIHSYSRCWIHLVWGTLNRERMLSPDARRAVAGYLTEYARGKEFFLKSCYVIAGQEEHHRVRPFAEEYERFVRAYELAWQPEEGNR